MFINVFNAKKAVSSRNSFKCLEPESNQWHEDFQSSALPTELSRLSSGDRIWTCDLRVIVVLAIGSFVVAVSSRKRAAELKVEADDEKRQTQEIIDWFLKNYSAKELDEQLLMEDPDLSGEELSLKRFELIQDFLITGRDIPDQSYADSLCETLYTKLYDQE